MMKVLQNFTSAASSLKLTELNIIQIFPLSLYNLRALNDRVHQFSTEPGGNQNISLVRQEGGVSAKVR